MVLTAKFRCSECGGSLSTPDHQVLICTLCGLSVPFQGGIADFVSGRFDTRLNAADYDSMHSIDDHRPSHLYNQIRARAGDRWPGALGSVMEVGCGTGLYSRALIAAGDARDVVLTDVSVAMLKQCRKHLERLGLLRGREIAFATYSANEPCLRDAVFDTVVGTSVLHHILDVRSFLQSIYKSLRPGGIAFFLEPARRFHRALAQSLADAAANLLRQTSIGTEHFQSLLNWLAQQRQSLLHHGDPAFLVRLEDKHQFVPEEFSDLAARIGFFPAEAIPFDVDPTGIRTANLLCRELGIAPPTRDLIAAVMLAIDGRFMNLLSLQDCAPSFLLWLVKPHGPVIRRFHDEPGVAPSQTTALSSTITIARWQIGVAASRITSGTLLTINGWYVSNSDVVGICIILDGVAQDVPVWLPRPDVQQSVNPLGRFAAWNGLCCGIEEKLEFQTAGQVSNEHTLELCVKDFNGTIRSIPGPDRISIDEKLNFVG